MMNHQDRNRFLYLRVLIDYFKINGHRIAHHAMSRTSTPLASRNDIKPLLHLINGEIADIITLDPESRKTFIKSVQFEELIAHFLGDTALSTSLNSLEKENLENIHFIFITNGVIMPTLLQEDYQSQYSFLDKISFYESRFDQKSVHGIGNPSIYMRKAVSQIRELDIAFEETEDNCSCGNNYWRGSYKIKYWDKGLSVKYSVCPNCGIQIEDPESSAMIMNFVQGLSAE
ncbi:MAG: hypothetical protein ACTSW1_04050 [Candidatus Hodarchaeales archaeon]